MTPRRYLGSWTLPSGNSCDVYRDVRLRFGYPELDAYVRGVAPGEVVAVLARSGVGKTVFGLNLAERMTAPAGLPVLLFSLEMPGIGVFERLAQMTTGWQGEEVEERARDGDLGTTMQELLKVVERWDHMRMVDTPCSLDRLDALIDGARGLWTSPLRLVLELPMPPAPGLRLALGHGAPLTVTHVTIAPCPAWGPGIVVPLIAVELAAEPPDSLAAALEAGWVRA